MEHAALAGVPKDVSTGSSRGIAVPTFLVSQASYETLRMQSTVLSIHAGHQYASALAVVGPEFGIVYSPYRLSDVRLHYGESAQQFDTTWVFGRTIGKYD